MYWCIILIKNQYKSGTSVGARKMFLLHDHRRRRELIVEQAPVIIKYHICTTAVVAPQYPVAPQYNTIFMNTLKTYMVSVYPLS